MDLRDSKPMQRVWPTKRLKREGFIGYGNSSHRNSFEYAYAYMRLWNRVSVTPATFLVQLKYSEAWSPPLARLRML